jgi:hypothetical protein
MNDEQRETVDACLAALKSLEDNDDTEVAHGSADDLIVALVTVLTGSTEIASAYDAIGKWYS